MITGRLTRQRIPRTNDDQQAGERYLLSEQWEKDDLVTNLVDALSQCDRPIQERMVWHLFMVEDELGEREGAGGAPSRPAGDRSAASHRAHRGGDLLEPDRVFGPGSCRAPHVP